MKVKIVALLLLLLVQSCASKKNMLYLQGATERTDLSYPAASIQANDILKISVGALVPEAALPYNKVSSGTVQGNNLDLMKLEGYVVSPEQTIEFPVLGTLSVKQQTPDQLAQSIKQLLEEGGHLSQPRVDVRVLNTKFTVLGEVKSPGTFSYTEPNITLLQALGYAGDLTLNGQREDVVLIRELDGERQISHIDLTASDWLNSEFYQIKPNDVLIVSPNHRAVNSSGLVDTGTLLSIASLTLSVVILLTR